MYAMCGIGLFDGKILFLYELKSKKKKIVKTKQSMFENKWNENNTWDKRNASINTN